MLSPLPDNLALAVLLVVWKDINKESKAKITSSKRLFFFTFRDLDIFMAYAHKSDYIISLC